MKRILCALLLLCLLLAVTPPAFADSGPQVQKLTIAIPCTVTVDVGKYGKVAVGGVTYTGATVKSFQVEPGTSVTFLITPSSGYTVSVLTLSGKSVLSDLHNGVYRVTINHDETLVVRFVKGTSPTPNSPKTADMAQPGLWSAMALASLGGLGCVVLSRKKRRCDGSVTEGVLR